MSDAKGTHSVHQPPSHLTLAADIQALRGAFRAERAYTVSPKAREVAAASNLLGGEDGPEAMGRRRWA